MDQFRRGTTSRIILAAVLASPVLALPQAGAAASHAEGLSRTAPAVAFGVAWFDVRARQNQALEGRLEYRAGAARFLRPFAVAMATSDGSSYLGAGVGWQLALGRGLVLTPAIGAGHYWKRNGKDLGLPLEFRSQLELACKVRAGARLGVAFSHLSNASLARRNPGQESLAVYYELALRRRGSR